MERLSSLPSSNSQKRKSLLRDSILGIGLGVALLFSEKNQPPNRVVHANDVQAKLQVFNFTTLQEGDEILFHENNILCFGYLCTSLDSVDGKLVLKIGNLVDGKSHMPFYFELDEEAASYLDSFMKNPQSVKMVYSENIQEEDRRSCINIESSNGLFRLAGFKNLKIFTNDLHHLVNDLYLIAQTEEIGDHSFPIYIWAEDGGCYCISVTFRAGGNYSE